VTALLEYLNFVLLNEDPFTKRVFLKPLEPPQTPLYMHYAKNTLHFLCMTLVIAGIAMTKTVHQVHLEQSFKRLYRLMITIIYIWAPLS